ncbi:peptidoglycan/LPS O-acetylase OafA/YrhL [Variovorax paradoxus]|uniref:Peptidoglycan/LPS O-acetylase OafA/YrhL n=2 Tax=Variovorax paradoxus TaxID=34073 RepID=A0AAE3Y361_VARPD|nr:peptidoglycan/LPS O-acetylase OafA/YrhL [Variovorax paradoxus]MDR6428261.1 peptidoglycan/LPS O-acetylase OafA/YrhL [Variovorax paradoxus]MDR6454915.1 peptidoglycan/LPS O-acetylase OafA/YrhL [Variovorax paradoxus]
MNGARNPAPAAEPAQRGRMPLLDIAKGVACAVIVGHHLSRYGTMPVGAFLLAPGLLGWLADDGRLAVQVFLVIAGFLAASSLAPDGLLRVERPMARILQRYGRLVMPYLAALTVSVLVAALVRPWMAGDDVPAAPSIGQLLAHGLLIQDLLGYEALSTGVWYVAIDFQLFVLALALMGLPAMLRRAPAPAAASYERWIPVALVLCLATASLLLFNRNADLDGTGFYFFGAYGLGMLAFWIGRATRASTWRSAIVLLALTGAGALAVDWRSRIATALVSALLIAVAQRRGWLSLGRWPDAAMPLQRLGRMSYSLFLIHFPVLLATNAAAAQLGPHPAWIDALGLAATFGLSVAAAQLLHRSVELRPASWRVVAALFAALLVSGMLVSL